MIMGNQRSEFFAEKIEILSEYLNNKMPIADICEKDELHYKFS